MKKEAPQPPPSWPPAEPPVSLREAIIRWLQQEL